jgi:hypothetical protein
MKELFHTHFCKICWDFLTFYMYIFKFLIPSKILNRFPFFVENCFYQKLYLLKTDFNRLYFCWTLLSTDLFSVEHIVQQILFSVEHHFQQILFPVEHFFQQIYFLLNTTFNRFIFCWTLLSTDLFSFEHYFQQIYFLLN